VNSTTKKPWGRLRAAWASLTGGTTAPTPPVVIHDPAAERAQDLDDPFLDPTAQSRAADLIARAKRKEG
jgi:hypothetical protein